MVVIMKHMKLWLLVQIFVLNNSVLANTIKVACPEGKEDFAKISRSKVYEQVPFGSGESSVYELTWMGTKVGYGTLSVHAPIKHNGMWHRVFRAKASTGDWFEHFFVAKEKAESISFPQDFRISKFYLEQNEGKLFASPFIQQKWLEFDHEKCKVDEKIRVPEKKDRHVKNDLARGAIDALGVAFYMRTLTYELQKKLKAPVYTSEKNWWLELEPLAVEEITVPAGKFKTTKIKLTTFLGKELQQKGDVYAWIATEHENKPLVQIQGEIKIGSVWIKLHKFKPGKS